jgi:hypothetical protein
MVPTWLHVLSVLSLVVGVLCALGIAIDETMHPQQMWIMNVVWPITALFGSVLWLWGYFRYGSLATHERMHAAKQAGKNAPNEQKPFAAMVAEATSHCGSGCALGDLAAEWLAFAVPVIAVWLGWHTIFSEKMFAVWVLDFIFAYAFGIVFQYFTIAPMRGLIFTQGLWAAIKADTLSLTAWQIGMYGFMAIANFWLFRSVLGAELKVNSVEFWFMMQIAMLCGFLTAYPVNWWLLRAGIKEKM